MAHKLTIEKRADGYWISANPLCDECGPYKTKAEAIDDRDGLERTLKYCDEPDFWTREKTL